MRSKMTTQAEKETKEGSLSLNKEAKRRRLDTDIDYTKCVICQGLDAKGLYNIRSSIVVQRKESVVVIVHRSICAIYVQCCCCKAASPVLHT